VANPKLQLRRPYDEGVGVFPCRSFNLGMQSVCYPHVDERNLAQSWCSVTALGQFDPNIGGHLVLWDLKLIVRFPPGSTILIPSALLVHSNTPIQPGEERVSIVQYVAGGLARWVNCGQKLEQNWLAQASPAEVQNEEKERQERWARMVELYTKIEDLAKENL
jgi:hypothetical protein